MKLTRQKTIRDATRAKIPKKIYLCPSNNCIRCSWEGECTELLSHFEENHEELLLQSSIFTADISNDSSQNYILYHQHKIFLVQTNYLKKDLKLEIRLRFLGSKEHAAKIKYSIEVYCGNFSFSNKHMDTGYNPVTNSSDGSIEVDVQGIMLICGRYNFGKLRCYVHIEDDWTEEDEIACRFAKFRNSGSFTDGSTDDDRSSIYSDTVNETFNYNACLHRGNAVDEDSACESVETNSSLHFKLSNLNNEDDENVNKGETTQRSDKNDELDSEKVAVEKFGNVTNEEKLDLLKCTNCKSYMIPPIFLCLNSHGVCHNCRLFDCKKCFDFVTKSRSFALESLSKTVNYPCRYSRNGCPAVLGYTSISRHEINCSFCPYTCNICSDFEGQIMDIRSHLRVHHSCIKIYDSVENIPFPSGSNFFIIDHFGVFHCTATLIGSSVEWMVVYCGSHDRQFSCEVNVFGKKGTNRQIYFLQREDQVYRMTVSQETLKLAGVKEKYANLHISKF